MFNLLIGIRVEVDDEAEALTIYQVVEAAMLPFTELAPKVTGSISTSVPPPVVIPEPPPVP